MPLSLACPLCDLIMKMDCELQPGQPGKTLLQIWKTVKPCFEAADIYGPSHGVEPLYLWSKTTGQQAFQAKVAGGKKYKTSTFLLAVLHFSRLYQTCGEDGE